MENKCIEFNDESCDEEDDCGVMCHYSKTTGGWEPIEEHCIECGYRYNDCHCDYDDLLKNVFYTVCEEDKNKLNKLQHKCAECVKLISITDDINSYHISDGCLAGLSWWCEDCWGDEDDCNEPEDFEEALKESMSIKLQWTKNY